MEKYEILMLKNPLFFPFSQTSLTQLTHDFIFNPKFKHWG